MAFDVRLSGEHAKVVLSGDVDLQTTADLKSEIQNISGVTRLEIDAANVTYIDSSGIAVLLLARQHCTQNNIALSLPTISDAVNRVLQIAKLDTMLPIGQVVNSADTGLMGLGGGEDAAPADDDDLVNELLSGDDGDFTIDPPVGAASDDDFVIDPPVAASADGDTASSSDFGGLDVGAVDFNEPADAATAEPSDDDAPVIDSGPMKPGTFS